MDDAPEERSRKRRRLSNEEPGDRVKRNSRTLIHDLSSPVSPPPLRRRNGAAGPPKAESPKSETPNVEAPKEETPRVVKSPFQLTWIRDLPESSNTDAVSLKDVLGDPLISECWEFNYLHDLEFLMDAFDPDVKDLVKVHVIHGFWKQEDQSRQSLQVGVLLDISLLHFLFYSYSFLSLILQS
jgi:tyrosyl-DNA phosphodiesterase-1